ncbi:MAG: ABC transporter ATP-binding protein [Bacteroidales bacterium]
MKERPESKQQNVIEVRNLWKKFGSFAANKDLSFDVKRAEIFGFLGANGAGKTTAIKILCGLWKPTSGEVKVSGYDVNTETEMVKRNIGYMSQKFSLYEDLTPVENIRFYGGIYGLSRRRMKEKTDEALSTLGLKEVRDKPVSALPLGWKQKLAFTVALLHEPGIVFLDEPTGGVDPVTRRQFWNMIYAEADNGTTIFVTTHYMDEAEYCDRVSIMVDGEIHALDTPATLKEKYHAESMNELFLKLARR